MWLRLAGRRWRLDDDLDREGADDGWAEIRLPPPCEGRHARSCAPPSIGRPPYRRARPVSRFPHWTSSSILLGVTACASTRVREHEGPQARRPTMLRPLALAGAPTSDGRLHHALGSSHGWLMSSIATEIAHRANVAAIITPTAAARVFPPKRAADMAFAMSA